MKKQIKLDNEDCQHQPLFNRLLNAAREVPTGLQVDKAKKISWELAPDPELYALDGMKVYEVLGVEEKTVGYIYFYQEQIAAVGDDSMLIIIESALWPRQFDPDGPPLQGEFKVLQKKFGFKLVNFFKYLVDHFYGLTGATLQFVHDLTDEEVIEIAKRIINLETSKPPTSEQGFTDAELAEVLGVGRTTVNRWRRGETQPHSPRSQEALQEWVTDGKKWYRQ